MFVNSLFAIYLRTTLTLLAFPVATLLASTATTLQTSLVATSAALRSRT